MHFFGISLRKPPFSEFTAASVMALGLWMMLAGLATVTGTALSRVDAAALLLVVWWGCVAVRMGIDLGGGGWRHWALSTSVAGVLLGMNQVIWAMAV